MLKFEYGHAMIFELIVAKGISSIMTCLSMNIDGIVTGLQIHDSLY